MRKKSIVSVLVAVAAFAAWAAVPVEFKVETDHADCLYRCGEKASFTITVTGKDGKKLSEGHFTAKLDNFGDVEFAAVREVAGWITPVPGGVGPMTRAMLLVNTLDAAERAAKQV